ncbi:MAG: alpha/beta hydrolase [Marinagarivorans sp.]|nr:alpha/beta hydrolase [Marinagarivorans sp.]
MFNQNDLLKLKKAFSPFSLDRMCRTTNTDLPALYHYLEYFGFLYTLKGLPVEYYCGYRKLTGKCSRFGRIATHYWRLSEAKGTVFIVHGLFDHVGLYQPAIRHLLDQGFSVVAIDLPGHGLSDGEPTEIDSFDSYADVVDECLAFFASKMQGPAYGFGQSTGGAVILKQCFRAQEKQKTAPYKGIILLAPLVRPCRWFWVRLTYRLLGKFLGKVHRNFNVNSHDESFNHFLATGDILQSRYLSVRWVGAMKQWVAHFKDQPMLDIPALYLQGTSDKVVDWRFNVPAITQKLTNSYLLEVPGAMHHLVNESQIYRQPLNAAISTFLMDSLAENLAENTEA